jgi:hypothetical protein
MSQLSTKTWVNFYDKITGKPLVLLEILLNSLTFRVSLSLNTDLGLHKITVITAMITTRISCTNFQNITLGYVVIKKIYQNKNKYLECINFQIIFSLSTLKTLKHESIFSCFVWKLTHVLLESWLMFCLRVDSCFVCELTHVLLESWLILSNKTWVNSQTKHESTLKQNMSQLKNKTWVNSQAKHVTHVLLESWLMFCLRVDSCFVCELTHVLLESWLMFCFWVDSCFVWELTRVLFVVNSQAKHESIFKQNMSQFSNKTWVNSQTKHGSSLKQDILMFCLRVDSCFVWELTHVLFESWLMFCLWIDSCFVWELTDVLFESWLVFCLWVDSCFVCESHKQNTSQLTNKTWVNSQAKHESTL